jgi:hypothetical protein
MTVTAREGLNFRNGWTWNVAAHKERARLLPAFEVAWDENGQASITGRYALMDANEANKTQMQTPAGPVRHEPEQLIDHDFYVEIVTRCGELGIHQAMR